MRTLLKRFSVEAGSSPLQKGKLRSILTGAIWTQDRVHRSKMAASALCPFCKYGSEDHFHLWWECPAWDDIRRAHGMLHHDVASQWPACFTVCSLVPSHFAAAAATPSAVIDLTQDEFPNMPTSGFDFCAAEARHNSRVIVYTDGASRDNQHRAIRRAGVGVFWATNHPFNIAETLKGASQTNNRAELTAVIRALEFDPRPLEIRTDSQYVFKGCTCFLGARHAAGWRTKGREISNVDLWQQVDR